MKTIFLVVALLTFASAAHTQRFSITEYDVHVGKAYPVSPQPFYDFWKPGLSAGGGVAFQWTPIWSALVLADYASFSVDRDRYFTAIGMSSDVNSLDGGTSTIVSASALLRYFPREGVSLPIFLLGGFGFAYSAVGQSQANFSGYEVNQPSEDWLVFSGIVGGGFAYPAKKFDFYVEGKYFIAILRGAGAHSNYTLLSAGIRVPL